MRASTHVQQWAWVVCFCIVHRFTRTSITTSAFDATLFVLKARRGRHRIRASSLSREVFVEETLDALKVRIRDLEKEVERWKSQVKNVRYGLNWLDVPEAFEKDSEDRIPILEEVPEKAIEADGPLAGKPSHVIIEGDNYHALTCLNYTHRGKIDVIYIDPPYNTGSDGFTYKDKRFLTEFPDGQKVPRDHPLRHSYWLSFMEKRLKLAKNLLSDRGVIFISIDDNEQANLKLLCDKIFGEGNFVGTYFWKRTDTPPALSYKIRRKLEFLLCYQRQDIAQRTFAQGYVDGGDVPLLNTGNSLGVLEFPAQSVHFGISDGVYKNKSTYKIELLDEVNVVNGVNVKPFKAKGHFKWGQDNLNSEVSAGTYFIIKTDKFSPRFQKTIKSTKVPSNIIDGEVNVGTNEDAKKELSDIQIEFDYAKPISLIGYISKIPFWNDSEITILDFFAGSGTTLHATLNLNREDGGSRRCILVQQSEGENNICERVTYERNRRVICGYTSAKGESIEGLGGSLKYYKTGFVGKHSSKNASDADKVELAEKAGCLIALAENTLETVAVPEAARGFWQIYSDGSANKKRYTCIYYNGDYGKVPEFITKIDEFRKTDKKAKFTVYVFSWNSPDFFENEFDDMRNVEIKAIPKPILEIYKALNG